MKIFDETSWGVEPANVPSEILDAVAEGLLEEFDQNSVIVFDDNAGAVYFASKD